MSKLVRFRTWLLGNPLCMTLLLLPYFEPYMFIMIPAAVRVFMGIKAVSMLCIAACFLARPRVSPVMAAIGVYQMLLPVIMLVNHSGGSLFHWVFETASIAAVCLLVDQAADVGPKALVSGMFYVLGTLCTVNLVTVLLNPGGMSCFTRPDAYFLGLDNSHGFFILPLLPAALLYTWNRRWPWWAQFLMVLFFTLPLYITWTVTGMLAATVFTVLFLLYRVKGSSWVCNICAYYAGIAAVFLLFVILQSTGRFRFLIENILHKSLDLSGRLELWDISLNYVKASLLLGYGFVTSERMIELAGQINCHNVLLQCLFDTGLVGTAVYLTALGFLIRPLMRLRSNFGGYILAAGVFAFLLLLQAESLVWCNEFYALLLLAANAEKVAAALDPGRKDLTGGNTV